MEHVDPDGYGMNYFIQKTGYQLNSDWLTNISNNYFESLSAGSQNPLESIKALIIDEGVVGFGHRKHLLAITEFYKPCYDIGIGWGYNINSEYKTYCCVLIAKHDWDGDTKIKTVSTYNKANEIIQNKKTNIKYESTKTQEKAKPIKTKGYKLLSIKFGGNANLMFDNYKKINSSQSNQLFYQFNIMLGFNLGKKKRNTSVGLFGNYGKYNEINTTLLNNNIFNSNNNLLEIEGGFLITEFLRLSGGLGFTSSNTINLSFNNYSIITAGLSIGPVIGPKISTD